MSLPMIAAVAATVLCTAAPALATYVMVWSDEFDGTTLDATNWTPDIGNGCPTLCGWGNNELQYYRAENVTVSGGNLVLTARDQNYGGNQFTSGKVTTRGKRTFLYGRVEMRAKLPVGGGMWPAFWMMPQDDAYGGWAASGEIDIMEASNAMTSIGGTIHYGGGWPANTSTGGSYSQGGTSFADDFHTYAVEWEPDVIRWYVDGVLYSTKTSAQWYSEGAPDNPRAPFDQEFYIILNAAVGGEYTGCTSSGCITADLPQEFLIDYVRVYEDVQNVPPEVAITSPAPQAELPVGDILIEATASDIDGSVARVEFYDGTTYLGQDATAPYSFLWTDVSDGCPRILVRAVDDLGGVGEDDIEIIVGSGCGQAPFAGSPVRLPARIEAEDFDIGGEGVAYHDEDAGNNGGQYRPGENVDIEACSDVGGGYGVGWIGADEWLEYTVIVPADGVYDIDVRTASLIAGGVFHIEVDGVDVTGDVAAPVTGGWQRWETVSTSAALEAGERVLRFVPTTTGFNVNFIEFSTATSVAAHDGPPAGHVLLPCYPNPFNPKTTIAFEMASSARVGLVVYDVAGKAVRTLATGEVFGAGPHRVEWNGRDDAGRELGAGVYFAKLSAPGFAQTRRMVLVK